MNNTHTGSNLPGLQPWYFHQNHFHNYVSVHFPIDSIDVVIHMSIYYFKLNFHQINKES